MCADSQSNWLNTIAVGASYILYSPRKNQNRNHFVFLSFGVDPLNCQGFIEIGEMACSTTALCSRKHNLKNKNYHPKKSF